MNRIQPTPTQPDESSADPSTGRPLIMLIGLTVFLATYVLGILRQQPFVWVAASSALGLLVMVGAGLLIERIMGSSVHAEALAEDGPAATYTPTPPIPTSEPRVHSQSASMIPDTGDD